MRDLIATIISPILKATGFRFSKDYRYGTSAFHRAIYFLNQHGKG